MRQVELPAGGEIVRADVTPRAAPTQPQRIVFCDSLRGLAAFVVVLTHWSYLFVAEKSDALQRLTGLAMPMQLPATTHTPVDWLASWVERIMALTPLTDFKWAPGGVMLFFLVSGFLIPRALGKGVRAFAIHRLFRLFPVWWTVLAVSIALAWFLVSRDALKAFPFTFPQILTNALLINDLAWKPFIEEATWTLVIELKFYLLMGALYLAAGRIGPLQVIVTAGVLLALQSAFASADPQNLYNHLSSTLTAENLSPLYFFLRSVNADIPFIIFMLCGSTVWFWWSGEMTGPKAIGMAALLFWMFCVAHLNSPVGKLQLLFVSAGLKTLALFALAAAAEKLVRSGRGPALPSIFALPIRGAGKVLRFLGDVSYPMYLLHGTAVGYPVLIVALFFVRDPFWVMAFALPGLLLASWCIHKLVENPGIRLGRRVEAR